MGDRPALRLADDKVEEHRSGRPGRRAQLIAAGVFLVIGAGLMVAFALWVDWWYRWVLLCLGVMGLVRALWHTACAWRSEVP